MFSPAIRTLAWAVAGALCVAGAAVTAAHHAAPAPAPARVLDLLSGEAWLASPPVGLLTLVDGSTARVAGQVRVPVTEAVQFGQNAYAVDNRTGMVRRIDGAAMTVGPGVTPIPGATSGLRVFATADVLYAVDTGSHRLALLDPSTLARLRDPVRLAEAIDPDALALDERGTLLVFDASTGTLARVTGSGQILRAHLLPALQGRLMRFDDRPVVAAMAEDFVTIVDPESGSVTDRIKRGRLARFSADGRYYNLVQDGQEAGCYPRVHGCLLPHFLSEDLHFPVGFDGRWFLSGHAGRDVLVIDPRAREDHRFALAPTGPGTFDLSVRDGMLFFNDPESPRAGLIHPDGTVLSIQKYDSSHSSGHPGGTARPAPRTSSSGPGRPTPTRVPFPGGPAAAFPAVGDGPLAAATPAPRTSSPVDPPPASPSPSPDTPSPSTPPPSGTPSASAAPPVLTVRTAEGGRVVGQGIDCGRVCKATFRKDQYVALIATADSGYVLDHWTGVACAGANGMCVVKVNCSRTVEAVFRRTSDVLQGPSWPVRNGKGD